MNTVKVLDGKGGELVFTHDDNRKIGLLQVVNHRIVGYVVDGGFTVPCSWDIDGGMQFGKKYLYKNHRIDLTPYDELSDLKRAYSEGAKIEVDSSVFGRWVDLSDFPSWDCDVKQYRIKGGISIESWDKHKDVIKAYWNGAEIEMDYSFDSSGQWRDIHNPDFSSEGEGAQYRVKRPEAVKMTMAEINKHFGKNIEIIE